MDRNMSGVGLFLEALQHGQAGVVRQAHVQQDRIGQELCGQLIAFVGTMGHQALIPQLMRQIEEDMRKTDLVLHHQNAPTGKRRIAAVIGKAWCLWCDSPGFAWRRGCRRGSLHRLNPLRIVFNVTLRQHQGEDTALPRLAADADRSAEQGRQVPRDRQPQPRATVTTIGGAVGLVERLENTFKLIAGNTDPRIANHKTETGVRLADDGEADRALFGELDRVRQQVLEHLFQALGIGEQYRRCIRLHLSREHQLLVGGQGHEHPAQAIYQPRDAGVLRTYLQLAGLDSGNVEDVIDQVEQVVARRVDRLGVLHLFGTEVLLGVLGQQFGQDQRTVQRCAQLMGHVGQELGLVLARTLQFFGTLFELGLGLVQLGVFQVQDIALLGQGECLVCQLLVGLLKLDLLGFQVGLGLLENPRLFLQLLVGRLELFLLHLQLFVELLGFGQHLLQALAIARRLERGADVAGNQLQQFDIALVQGTQKAQLDHPVDLVVVRGRHHQHAAGCPLTQS
ncbi:hypothetical protein D3C78_806480 [compost metagenome]